VKIPDQVLVVARHLRELRSDAVFVGGMIRSLLVTDPGAGRARPTDDVDLIVNTADLADYYALNDKLRANGFRESSEEGAPICRWIVGGVPVDVMPVDPAILGFSNVWYFGAHKSSLTVAAADGTIQILNGPHFCATKLEAFLSRGNDDLYHHDLEDFIAIVDGRPALLSEIKSSPHELQAFLAHETAALLGRDAFLEALPGHLDSDEASQQRLPLVRALLRAIADLELVAALPAEKFSAALNIRPAGPFVDSRPALDYIFTRSSNLRGASYDAATATLTIEFHGGGRRYQYKSVPANIYSGLIGAASAGRYHHQWIKKRFRYTRLV
jgi:predicted nucleotidyltransferase